MTNRLSVAILLLTACGDNAVPVPETPGDAAPTEVPSDALPRPTSAETWGDAESVWADAWCQYAARCYPDEFPLYYDGVVECAADVQGENCAYQYRPYPCEEVYPQEKLPLLLECYDEMVNISCDASYAPSICLAAFND